MASATKVATTWAVLDHVGRVVVLFEGREAQSAAHDWAGRGYRVEPVKAPF